MDTSVSRDSAEVLLGEVAASVELASLRCEFTELESVLRRIMSEGNKVGTERGAQGVTASL